MTTIHHEEEARISRTLRTEVFLEELKRLMRRARETATQPRAVPRFLKFREPFHNVDLVLLTSRTDPNPHHDELDGLLALGSTTPDTSESCPPGCATSWIAQIIASRGPKRVMVLPRTGNQYSDKDQKAIREAFSSIEWHFPPLPEETNGVLLHDPLATEQLCHHLVRHGILTTE